MTYKIYILSGLFHLERADGELHKGLAGQVFIAQDKVGDDYVRIENLPGWFDTKKLKISDLQDADGITFTQQKITEFSNQNANSSEPIVYKTTGTITGPNEEVTLQCPGAAGAIVTFVGTFTGELRAVGGTDGVDGPRILFKSGVGSIGTNKVVGDGVFLSREYRIIAGGDRFSIKSGGNFTGSVTIEIISSQNTNNVFVSGYVHTKEEESILGSQGFLASTRTIQVTAGNVLGAILRNPIDSGVNIILRRRLFSNNTAATSPNLEYIAYNNPTRNFANSGNGINLRSGDLNSVAVFQFENVTQSNLNMGGILGSGEILPRGTPYCRTLDFILSPGKAVGFSINGAGNNLGQAARFSITLEWIETTIN